MIEQADRPPDPPGTPYRVSLGAWTGDGWAARDSLDQPTRIIATDADGSPASLYESGDRLAVARTLHVEFVGEDGPLPRRRPPAGDAITLAFAGNLTVAEFLVEAMNPFAHVTVAGRWAALFNGRVVARGLFDGEAGSAEPVRIDCGGHVFNQVRIERPSASAQGEEPAGADFFLSAFRGSGPAEVNGDYLVAADQVLEVSSAVGVVLPAEDAAAATRPVSVVAIDGRPVADGDTVTLASGARLTIHADGSFAYDPNGRFAAVAPGQLAADGFDYTVADGRGGFDTVRASIGVIGVSPPADARERPDAAAVAATMGGCDNRVMHCYRIHGPLGAAHAGLHGEFYRQREGVMTADADTPRGGLNSLAMATALISHCGGVDVTGSIAPGNPDSTFTVRALTRRADGVVASGNDPWPDAPGVIRLVGYLLVTTPGIDFHVRWRGGFVVRIGDTLFGEPGLHPLRERSFAATELAPGLQQIEIVSWSRAGAAALAVDARPADRPADRFVALGDGAFGLFRPTLEEALAPGQTLVAGRARRGGFFVAERLEMRAEPAADEVTATFDGDVMYANAEAVEYRLAPAGHAFYGRPAVLTLSDFRLDKGDVLNLAGVLAADGGAALTDFLRFERSGADTLVHVSSTGGFVDGYVMSAEDQLIVLRNVDIDTLGSTDQEIVAALSASDSLVTR